MKTPTEKKAVQKCQKMVTFFTGPCGLPFRSTRGLPGRWREAVEESPLTHPKLVPSVKVSSYDLSVGCEKPPPSWRFLGRKWFHFSVWINLVTSTKISPKITKSPQMIAKLTHAKYQISGRPQVQQDLLQALAKSKHSVFSETICQSAPHFPLRLGFSDGTFGRPTPNRPPIPLL